MEQRNRIREATRGDWRDLYAIQRQERRRFADAQRNAWSRMRFHIGTYRDDYRKAGKSGRKDMLKGAVSALISSKAERERLERKQKNERLYFADKLRRQAERLKRPIDEQHKTDLAKLTRRHDDEHHKMRMAHSKESQAQAREIKEGRDKELFREEQRGKLRQELKENKTDVAQSNVPAKPPSLADKFAKASQVGGKQQDQAKTAEERKPVQSKSSTPQRAEEFKKNAKEATERKEQGPERSSLAEKFHKAQERGVGAKSIKHQFKENADDLSQDLGRELSKKPPK